MKCNKKKRNKECCIFNSVHWVVHYFDNKQHSQACCTDTREPCCWETDSKVLAWNQSAKDHCRLRLSSISVLCHARKKYAQTITPSKQLFENFQSSLLNNYLLESSRSNKRGTFRYISVSKPAKVFCKAVKKKRLTG